MTQPPRPDSPPHSRPDALSGAQVAVLTVTLNPALDLTTAADQVVSDLKLRCDPPEVEPGGGGINVSRGIAEMGGQSTALVALGGATGTRIAGLLTESGIALLPLAAPGESRESLSVHDRQGGGQYRFVLPGPSWSEAEVEAALTAIATAAAPAAAPGALVVLSGSHPPGVPARFPARLADRLAPIGARLIVDTSGPALGCLASGDCGPVEVLRMDSEEAEALAGHALPMRSDTAFFAQSLVARQAARAVIVARGRDGNIIATADEVWHAEAARVRAVSKIGAGDAFVAGFTLGLARDWAIPEAMGLAAAAATACVQMPGSRGGDGPTIARYFEQRAVTRLA